VKKTFRKFERYQRYSWLHGSWGDAKVKSLLWGGLLCSGGDSIWMYAWEKTL